MHKSCCLMVLRGQGVIELVHWSQLMDPSKTMHLRWSQRPSYLPSFLASFFPSFLPCFLPSFLPSFLPWILQFLHTHWILHTHRTGSLLSGSVHFVFDLEMHTHWTGSLLHGTVHSGSLKARATDFRSGNAHSLDWESTPWESNLWESIGLPILDLQMSMLVLKKQNKGPIKSGDVVSVTIHLRWRQLPSFLLSFLQSFLASLLPWIFYFISGLCWFKNLTFFVISPKINISQICCFHFDPVVAFKSWFVWVWPTIATSMRSL